MKNSFIKWIFVSLLFGIALGAHADPVVNEADVPYQYATTRQLVSTVQAAAKLFHQQGSRAFATFNKPNSRWRNRDSYLFIYNLQGKNVYHGMDPSLQGKSMVNFKDSFGRSVIQEMIAIAKNKAHPSGWVHYQWAGPDHFFPMWKSSYVMRVTNPQGQVFFIGAGIYNMKTEKVFIEHVVNQLVATIKSKGLNAVLQQLSSKNNPYFFKENYPFILTMQGVTVFDPAFPSPHAGTGVQRNLYNFTDAVGKKTVQLLIQKMKTQPAAWVMYMWPKPDETQPARKLIYVRRVMVDGKMLIVGSELFVETPIWM